MTVKKISLTHLNINGWTESNDKLRNELLNTINSGIISVNETHLPGNNEFMLNPLNFQGIWHNCTTKNRKAPHNFGVVGFLINKQVMQAHTVEICDKTVDGLLVIMLENKYTTYKIMIMICCMPLKNSIYCRDSSVQ